MFQDLSVHQRFIRALLVEHRDRHAPGPLTEKVTKKYKTEFEREVKCGGRGREKDRKRETESERERHRERVRERDKERQRVSLSFFLSSPS